MIDDVAYLIEMQNAGTDQNGNEILQEIEHKRFCRVRSVTRNEFYDAATDDLRPELVLTISHAVDYNGETVVKFRGKYYDVMRTYYDGDAVELTLTGKIGISARDGEETTE